MKLIKHLLFVEMEPGDFKASVGKHQEPEALLLPRRLCDILREQNINSAEEFLTYVCIFPSFFVAKLSWSLADVAKACEKLKEQLRGYIHEDIIDSPPQPKHGTGALPPAQFKWEIGTTVASVDFVRDAERCISRCRARIDASLRMLDKFEERAGPGIEDDIKKDQERIVKLEKAVEQIKKHEWVLQDTLTVKDFFDGKIAQ